MAIYFGHYDPLLAKAALCPAAALGNNRGSWPIPERALKP
ncbi:hypothetical protein EMIT0P176_280032 [Pseudomonas sp. IT-P176]